MNMSKRIQAFCWQQSWHSCFAAQLLQKLCRV